MIGVLAASSPDTKGKEHEQLYQSRRYQYPFKLDECSNGGRIICLFCKLEVDNSTIDAIIVLY